MRLTLLIFLGVVSFYANAQQVIDIDKSDKYIGTSTLYASGGEIFVNTKYVSIVSGTPYFKDEWMKGAGITKDSQSYSSNSVKFDLIAHQVHYLDEKGEEMVVRQPFVKVKLSDNNNATYEFVNLSTGEYSGISLRGWGLLLQPGKASLYKVITKKIFEQRPYNSATYEQEIKTMEDYYIVVSNTIYAVTKSKDVPEVLTDKKAQLQDYLKNKEKSGSVVDKLKAIVSYYNSLYTEQK